MNRNFIRPERWFTGIPVPSDPWDAQKAVMLQTLFRSMVVFSLLFLSLSGIWVNKTGALLLGAAANITLLWIPYLLMRSKRVNLAAWTFTICLALMAQVLLTLSGGVRSPVAFGIFPVCILAGLLTGSAGAIACSIFLILGDLALVLLGNVGVTPPLLFPMPPIATWFLLLLMLVYVLPPLIFCINRARRALEQTSLELERHRQAKEKITYQTQLLEHSPDPILALDQAHLVTFWNNAAERIFRVGRSEALGSNILALLGTENEPSWIKCCEQTSLTGEWKGELPFQSTPGERILFDATVTNLMDASGKVISRVAALRDITAAKNAEEALRKSEERLHLLTDAAPVGILLLDNANRVAFANRYVSDRLGLVDGVAQNTYASLGVVMSDLDGRILEPKELPTQRVRQTGKPIYDVHLRGTNRQGQSAILSVSVAPLPGTDQSVDGLIVVFDDITEQTKLQEQYLQAQKMESVGLLAGGIAHDFNNLLLVITGYCEKILSSLSEEDPLRPELNNVLLAGERAADLTQQLLAVGRKQIASARPLSLNRLVQQLQSMLRGGLRDDVALTFEHEGEDGWVLADLGQMNQVLMNLVINSEQAMPNGGRIVIRTRRMTCPPGIAQNGTSASGDCVELEVEDTGTGMSVETLNRMFEPFFTTKERQRNSGLGLSTVYGIVKQSGGWIDVQSTLGSGTRFRVYLPETPPQKETTTASKPSTLKAAGGTVLVVEDRDEVREFLSLTLKNAGYEVLQASCGEDALAVSSSHQEHIDVLLSDVIMPGMSGKELAVVLLSRRTDLKVILMSGYANELLEARLNGSMQFEMLQKPFTPRRLIEKLREVCQSVPELQ